jgi:hypothetical protein
MKAAKAQCNWVNVMESLVVEEVELQFRQFSPRQQSFISPDAVTTYALNRLQPLYANSTKGYECQSQLAREKLSKAIATAVRQGIAAVERDPLRASQPLLLSLNEKAERALQAMQHILQRNDLDWDNLPDVLEAALNSASNGDKNWQLRSAKRPSPPGLDWTTRRLRSRH